jgi:sodium/bile acid cotransporter 7
VKLNPQSLKQGLSNYKLHLLIQGTTFLIFQAIILLQDWERKGPCYG